MDIKNQKFEELMRELRPVLQKISRKNRFLGFIDAEDLYQEALINLWDCLETGELSSKNKSYILKGCYFHIQNYLRTHKVKAGVASLDEEVSCGEEVSYCLRDLIADHRAIGTEESHSRLIVEKIRNNGLTIQERKVFNLLYEGFNLREVAAKLSISHVRVLKIKQGIRDRYRKKFLD